MMVFPRTRTAQAAPVFTPDNARMPLPTPAGAWQRPIGQLGGYVVLWDRPTDNPRPDGSRHVFAPHSLTWARWAGGAVRAAVNHETNTPLGSTDSNRRLALTPTERGLFFRLTLPATENGRRVLKAGREGGISGSSFGCFIQQSDTMTWRGERVLYVTNAELREVSVSLAPRVPAFAGGVMVLDDREVNRCR